LHSVLPERARDIVLTAPLRRWRHHVEPTWLDRRRRRADRRCGVAALGL